jgi:hypothetical protein
LVGLSGPAFAAARLHISAADMPTVRSQGNRLEFYGWENDLFHHEPLVDLIPTRFSPNDAGYGPAQRSAAVLRDAMRAARFSPNPPPTWDPDSLEDRVEMGYRDEWSGPVTPRTAR